MTATGGPADRASGSLAEGTILAERYRIRKVLGEGAMGVVYLAEHTHMRNAVAVKILHPSVLSHPEIVARFEREAIAAGRIEHPNVASAKDCGRLANGSFFLVLEYVNGRTLRSELDGSKLGAARAVPILRGICAALRAAHAKGIVHRDLKPENVMLVESADNPDFVKVLDFGIAKVSDTMLPGGPAEQPLTQFGSVFGTPEYMAPEQARGTTVDHRADLYAMGIIFYEMLAGHRPFNGDGVNVLRQHVFDEVPPIDGLDSHLEKIVARLLAKEVDDRFQTAADLETALNELVVGSAQTMLPPIPLSVALAPVRARAGTPAEERPKAPKKALEIIPTGMASTRPNTEFLASRTTRVALVTTIVAAAGILGFVLAPRATEDADADANGAAESTATTVTTATTAVAAPSNPVHERVEHPMRAEIGDAGSSTRKTRERETKSSTTTTTTTTTTTHSSRSALGQAWHDFKGAFK